MSATQWTAYALDEDWEPRVTGRAVEVPKPVIVTEGEDSEASIKDRDVVVVKDGGTTNVEPGTLGHRENTQNSFVQVDIRTTDRNRPAVPDATRSPGYVRLFGKRDNVANVAERYGGLVGEVTRILQTYRRGVNEFTRIQIEDVNDISSQSGVNHYRATLTVRFDQTLQNVEPTL